MSFPMYRPRQDYGERVGQRTSSDFLEHVQDELYAARGLDSAWPLEQTTGPYGTVLNLDRATLDIRRFKLTADLDYGSSAAASTILFNSQTNLWTIIGDTITVYDSQGSHAEGNSGVYLPSGTYGFAKWFPDNGRWEIIASIVASDGFFPARIDCRQNESGTWVYDWTEMEWLSALAEATVKSGGRVGYGYPAITITVTTTGTVSTAEVETITFCGQPPTAGTWTLTSGAYTTTDLAYNADAAAVQAALRALNSSSFPLVTVSGSYSSRFTVTWPSNGVQTTLTGDVTDFLPAVYAWPACELNNRKVPIGLIVWMKRGYTPSSPAVAVITKTTAGNGMGTYPAFSLYMDQVAGGSFTLNWNGTTTPAISFGLTGAQVKTIITGAVSGLTLSSFSGAGTLASPWTFTVTSSAADITVSVNGANLKGLDGYRFWGDPFQCLIDSSSSIEFVTNVTWDDVTCEMTMTKQKLSELLDACTT